MTNNINGIDVSECVFFKERYTRIGDDVDNDISFENHCMLSEYPFNIGNCEKINCYFKQLKRLEQREKALTELADDLQKRNHDLTLTNERLAEENEELKKRQITKNGFICDCEQDAKYREALEEIKEISEPVKKDICNNCGWQDSDCCEPEGCACNEFITILHKIDEVLKCQ